MYHKCRLPTTRVQFRVDVHLSSIDDAIAATWEVLGDEQPDSSPGGDNVSVTPAAGDEKGVWDFRNLLVGPYTGRERRVVLDNIRGLIRRAGFLALIMAWMSPALPSAAFVTVLR